MCMLHASPLSHTTLTPLYRLGENFK
jgi:hypothetical protein